MAKRKEYISIAFAGRMNAGKSSLLNLLSGQKDFAIVDAQPGTTADTVITTMEIHGMGPVKVFDTAGLDEDTELGKKKQSKTFEAVEEADLTFVVIDLLGSADKDLTNEIDTIKRAEKHEGQVLVIYNIFADKYTGQDLKTLEIEMNKRLDQDIPSLCLDASDTKEQRKLIDFIATNFERDERDIDLIPLEPGKGFVLLNIPMDEETPMLRLLRPQDMALERLLRKFLIPVLFRMDLGKARAGDEGEKKRFTDLVKTLQDSPEGLKLVITDSQAMDIMGHWTAPEIPLTTFSIVMANFMSYGDIDSLLTGLEAVSTLKNGDSIIVMESCNHDRKCNDIGTNQIPNLIKTKLNLDLKIEFAFGRVMPDDVSKYKLAIHCGGCMADRQKYGRRIKKLRDAGVPVTNYGLFLSWVHNPQALKRVTKLFDK